MLQNARGNTFYRTTFIQQIQQYGMTGALSEFAMKILF